MNLLIWIIAGSAAGAISSILMHQAKPAAQRQDPLLNTVVGAVGALLGGSLLAPIFGTGGIDIQHYTNEKLVIAIAGALKLLTVVNFFGQFNKR